MEEREREQDGGGHRRGQDRLGTIDVRKELTFFVLGAAFRYAHIQEPCGHGVNGGVNFVGDIFGEVLIEMTLRGIQPFLGEDHDQKHEKGQQAELGGQHLGHPAGAVS